MIRAWVVDDELLAVKRLSRMLLETGRVEIAGTSNDPETALEQIAESAGFDVLFLDIEMPGMNGFELLSRLEEKPLVVFTTAYDQYAVKAFEVNGTDYLLKPVTPAALERALQKIDKLKASPLPDYQAMLDRLSSALQTGRTYPKRLPSRLGDRVQFIDLESVSHFYAEGKLTYAVSQGKSHVVDDSIIQLEAKVDPTQFQRIHRGYMVNLSAVREIHSWFGGKLVARLNDAAGTELPVARDRVKALKDRLGF